MYEWKIRVANNLKHLEQLVEEIQSEGWTIEKIDVKSVSVVAYKAKKARPDLLVEDQPRMSGTMVDEIRYYRPRNEGRIEPETDDWDRGDYGQQEI